MKKSFWKWPIVNILVYSAVVVLIPNRFFLILLIISQTVERLENEELMAKMQELENSTARVSTGVPVVFGNVVGCRKEGLHFELCIFFSTGCREARGGKLHVERKHSNPRRINNRKLQGFCWYRLLRDLFLRQKQHQRK